MNYIKKIWESIYKILLLKANDERRINYLRKLGVKIGQRCRIRTMSFSTEPYLIEIGNHVAVAAGTQFITHDGATWVFEDEVDGGGIFGKIVIGNNVFIGIDCILLSNTSIGDNCIVGAGSVVRGHFPKIQLLQEILPRLYQKQVFKECFQNECRYRTRNFTVSQKDKLVKKHFGIE